MARIRWDLEDLLRKDGVGRTTMMLHSSFVTENWVRFKQVAEQRSTYSSPGNPKTRLKYFDATVHHMCLEDT